MGPSRVVLELFHHPRNKRAMASPTAKGILRGKAPGKDLVLYLRVAAGVVVDASFTNTVDRVEDAPLSMLTTLLIGRPVDDARRMGLLDLARALESEAHPGIAVGAIETLRDALFALDRVAPPPLGTQVCTCFTVHEERICRYVREHQLDSVEEVNRFTRACGGCRSCRVDVERLIERTLGRPARDA